MEKKNFLIVLILATVAHCSANAKLPGVFILGDSTADVGTNNFLPESPFKANFPPNGIDFPNNKPTGRFSNGYNSADSLAISLGLKISPPPYVAFANNTSARRRQALVGFNFASGGSGILDTTGRTNVSSLKNVVPLGRQVIQFSKVHKELLASMGPQYTKEFVSKSLFFFSVGSNDMLAYYNLSRSTVPKERFLSFLGSAYENHLRILIKLGARKFGIIAIPPLGCCPSQRIQNTTGGCLEELNDLAKSFHSTIKSVMNNLSSEFSDIKYSLGDAFEMTMNVIKNPSGLEVETACCGTGKFNAESYCSPEANLCSTRDVYLFWDLFHPTEAASKLAAYTLYNGGPEFVAPINFSELVKA